jgi:general nucleoside transport system permease protein
MAEKTKPTTSPNLWRRISPRLMPLFAVITALLIGIPFIIFTAGRGDVARGLNIVSTAYSALLEGSTGIAYSDVLSRDDFPLVDTLLAAEPLQQRGVRQLVLSLGDVEQVGLEQLHRYRDTLAKIGTAWTDEQYSAVANALPNISAIGPDTLRAADTLLAEADGVERAAVRDLAAPFAAVSALTAEQKASVVAVLPSAATLADAQLLALLQALNEPGLVAVGRAHEALVLLDAQSIALGSQDAQNLAAIERLTTGSTLGVVQVREMLETESRMATAGITDLSALVRQLRAINALYSRDLFTEADVKMALESQLPPLLAQDTVFLRPGNDPLLINPNTTAAFGAVMNNKNTPDNPADDRTDAAYVKVGGGALLFFPAQLEGTLVRAIPFVIAGLAVMLGFKAGLFNIGAEGQLYFGAVFTTALVALVVANLGDMPAWLFLPLVIVMGLLGGALWGAIPGILKAYTGAHEVINTIMLNFIAIRFVDWIIKSETPVILGDPASSTPQTADLPLSARLPTFDTLGWLWFVIAGVGVAAFLLYSNRDRLNAATMTRAVLWGLATFGVGLACAAIAVEGRLHIGLVLMVLAVLLTDWFLHRTTSGFELRTVGSNADAAKYAGMSVARNIILAMAFSGALAGLAGAIEISGVQHNMKPDFFAGVGFDAIAVALLARNNPRGMILAGLLWGGLYAGASTMQARAGIAIDLVKIIQALIIMFVAADVIIRTLWRVPEATPEERAAAMFNKGMGS